MKADQISLDLWGWYAVDEFEPVLKVCELAKALEFLSLPALEQSTLIPYCPACETWSEMMLPIDDFLKSFSEPISASLREKLEAMWVICNSLSQPAFHCDDYDIFENPEWEPLRMRAIEVLQMLDWSTLQNQIDELMIECRKALFPQFYKGEHPKVTSAFNTSHALHRSHLQKDID